MRQWTLEERARQAEMIRNWKPWERSTGPKTEDGKEVCKMNAYKHGMRGEEIRALQRMLTGGSETGF